MYVTAPHFPIIILISAILKLSCVYKLLHVHEKIKINNET